MSAVGISSEQCGTATTRKGCKDYAYAMAGARLWVVLFTLHFIWFNRRYARAFMMNITFDCLVMVSVGNFTMTLNPSNVH